MSGLQAERPNQSSRRNTNKLRNLNSIGPSSLNSMSLASGPAQPNDDYFFEDETGLSNPNRDFLVDLFEDNMLEEVGSIDSKEEKDFFEGRTIASNAKEN